MLRFSSLLLLLAVHASLLLPALATAQNGPKLTVVLASREAEPDAQAFARAMAQEYSLSPRVLAMTTPSGMRYRVVVGSFADRPSALEARDKLVEQTGIRDAWLLILPPTNTQPDTPADSISEAGDLRQGQDSLLTQASDSLAYTTKATELLPHYRRMLGALTQQDYRVLNGYIHPEQGLWVYYKPDSLVLGKRLRMIQDLFDVPPFNLPEGENLFAWDMQQYDSIPRYGLLPLYDCRRGYDKQGLHISELQTSEKFHYVILSTMKRHALGQDLTQEERRSAVLVEAFMQLGVRSTESELVRTLYFSRIDGGWYLTAIDIIEPCMN